MSENEITRTVAIEHAGEKIQIEVHVTLTREEIERVVTPAVLRSLNAQHITHIVERELETRLRQYGHPIGGVM